MFQILYGIAAIACLVSIIWLIVAAVRKKAKKVPLIILIISLLVGVVLNPIVNPDSGTDEEGASSTVSEPANTPTPAPSAAPSYEATPDSMQQLFTDTFDFDYSDLSCTMQDEDGENVCTVSYKDNEAAWDESAIVMNVLSTFVDFQRLAYQVDGINGVRFEVYEDMVDDRGNTSSEWVFTFMMDKETCALYNWDSLSGLSIFDQMQRDCKEFYIAPGILSKVNTDDVIYHSSVF